MGGFGLVVDAAVDASCAASHTTTIATATLTTAIASASSRAAHWRHVSQGIWSRRL